ncbi:hypothetical protein Fmac_006265 [Flemingia macrophylla]|uniref:Uncharacterized protein n=1 Tax=Flemingia macrophylla TaxID=520843 RepID=A0ABD1NA69_9FABA
MSNEKEEKFQAVVKRIKAAAFKGRNANAYGRKKKGEMYLLSTEKAKRQMYLMSTEKVVKLGEREDLKPSMSPVGGAVQCQKCYQNGHWTYECKYAIMNGFTFKDHSGPSISATENP